ncbi:hypothetical protein [Haliscomenobacter sp.]|uniref:hypothetical protein n=1 Tax=Haliscomenobacter sp. TaxID=2717303 RepID=UPI003593D0F5
MKEKLSKAELLVSKDRLDDALLLLKSIVNDQKIEHTIYLLQSRLDNLKMAQIKGLESFGVLGIERNKIVDSILQLINLFEKESNEPSSEKESNVLNEILADLRSNYQIYERIRKIRAELRNKLEHRYSTLPEIGYIELFSKYYKKMQPEELRQHQILRNYTINILKKHNDNILKLIRDNSILKAKIHRLSDLEIHLVIWNTEYENTIMNDESICQVYVLGEESKFPDGIEKEIKSYIENN